MFYRTRSLGSAALSLCYLAMGAIDICSFEYLKCWDVAAGILIIQEAGGIVLDSKGKLFILYKVEQNIIYLIENKFFLGEEYKDIMNPNIVTACTRKLADNFLELKSDSK